MNDELPLRDIHAAAIADWWPLAPLSWVLLLLLFAALTVALVAALRRWFRARRRRAMLNDLEQLRTAFGDQHSSVQLAQGLSQWLRRLLLHRGGPEAGQVAGMTGARWSGHLAGPFSDDQRLVAAAEQIASQPWQAKPTLDDVAAFDLARAWIDRLSQADHV